MRNQHETVLVEMERKKMRILLALNLNLRVFAHFIQSTLFVQLDGSRAICSSVSAEFQACQQKPVNLYPLFAVPNMSDLLFEHTDLECYLNEF